MTILNRKAAYKRTIYAYFIRLGGNMATKSNSSMSPRTNALAILARIIAHDILRKARSGNGDSEIVANVTDKGASENNSDTDNESSQK
jgi:hypothetical protein